MGNLFLDAHTLLWGEFLFDYWYWLARKDFENNYTTLLEVNHNGNDKIFMNWHVSDKYKGCYGGIGLTRNMVDINIYIPSRNLFCEEHFCFQYFNRYLGSVKSCVINKLKVGIGCLYDRYFFDMWNSVHYRQSYMCLLNKCGHNETDCIPQNIINSIPQWVYWEVYRDTGIHRVSYYILLHIDYNCN